MTPEDENKKLIDPDDDDLDYDDEPEGDPDYYYCYGCGYSTITDHGSWGCPRCTAIMSPEYY